MERSLTLRSRAAPAGLLLFAAACSGAPRDDGAPDYELTSKPPPAQGGDPSPGDGHDATTDPPRPDEGDPEQPVTPGATTWCSTHPATFCADFAKGPLPAGFASMDGTYLSLAKGALVLAAPALASGPAFTSKLMKPFATASSDMTLAFDLAADKVNTKTASLLVAAIDFPYPTGPAPGFYSVRLTLVGGRARIEEYVAGATGRMHPFFDLPAGKLSRVSIDLALGAAGGSVKVSLDGKQVGVTEPLAQPSGVDHTPKLLVGAVYGTAPTDGWKLRFANVTMDLR